jgi:hypothetical protein
VGGNPWQIYELLISRSFAFKARVSCGEENSLYGDKKINAKSLIGENA